MVNVSAKIISKNAAEQYLEDLMKIDFSSEITSDAQILVSELAAATPKRSAKTASSWDYKTQKHGHGGSVEIKNSNTTSTGMSVAKLIYYGHGTGTGGYVPPYDFMTPALDKFSTNVSRKLERRIQNGK